MLQKKVSDRNSQALVFSRENWRLLGEGGVSRRYFYDHEISFADSFIAFADGGNGIT